MYPPTFYYFSLLAKLAASQQNSNKFDFCVRFALFLSLKMTYPVRRQRTLEVSMGSSLTNEHIERVLQSDQRLLVI